MSTRIWILSVTAGLLLAAIALIGGPAVAAGIDGLRGSTPIPETANETGVHRLQTGERYQRNYRQQPPLVPHPVRKYQVDKDLNECLGCHSWENYVQEGATKVSETHYIARDGSELDHVSNRRWNCTQCHVPQTNARPLVDNEYTSPAR